MNRALRAYPSALVIRAWAIPILAVGWTVLMWSIDEKDVQYDLLIGLALTAASSVVLGLASIPFTRELLFGRECGSDAARRWLD